MHNDSADARAALGAGATHRARIAQKRGLKTTADFVRYAADTGPLGTSDSPPRTTLDTPYGGRPSSDRAAGPYPARASIVSRATAGPVVMPLPRMPVTR
jgi:hypothetical protein